MVIRPRPALLLLLFWAFSCGVHVRAAFGSVTASTIAAPDQLLPGAWSYGRVGDFILENDLIAVVISAIGHAELDAASGGNIIDAGSSTARVNALGGLYTYFNNDWPRQAVYTSLSILDDGSGGGPAVIEVNGRDSMDPHLTVTTHYSLADGNRYVTISTTLTNTGSATYSAFELGDCFQWGDCLVFVPGFGFSFPENTAESWIAGSNAHVSYGYVSPQYTLWGPHGAQWSDLNVRSVSLGPGHTASYDRCFVVGTRDVASVASVIHGIIAAPTGSIDCLVVSEATGLPVEAAAVDAFDGSDNPYLQMKPDGTGSTAATLPPGNWTVVASAFGHLSQEAAITMTVGGAISREFLLTPDGTEVFPVGDTLTVIQRPLLNIPALVIPGDTMSIRCEADPSTLDWSAELRHEPTRVPLEIVSSSFDAATSWWSLSAVIPEVELFELYDLAVTVDGGEEDVTRNAVSVLPEFKDDFYFIHITDAHLPTDLYYYQNGAETDSSEVTDLREVIEDINIINPAFVLLTGDLIHEGELEGFLGRRVYTHAQRLLTEFDTPVFLTAGNHDVGGWPSTPPPAGTARREWWRFFGWERLDAPGPGAHGHTQDYSFDYGPVHFVGLEAYDNYDMWRLDIYGETSFGEEQLMWLVDDLNSASGSTSQVLFHHFDFADQLNLSQLGIDMALWGHIHDNWGSISSPPYDLATNNVCGGERSYRLIRVSNGILQPSATVSAGYSGGNLSVAYSPANNGTSVSVTAEITNNLSERFEYALLRVMMPNEPGSIDVMGGTLQQIDRSDSLAVCYVAVEIDAYSSQQVTVTLDALSGELIDGEVVLTWPPWPGATAYWVYAAANEPCFEPGLLPPYEHRVAVLGQWDTSWSSPNGVGDPDRNWSFMIVPVDATGSELARLGAWAEADFSLNIGASEDSESARE
ncbi:MAG: metallophosphoesterase [Candidatus Eisenbacteria bacterium]|nr:metallophosphoesterase [Candidatus Eisenbacteria bacterium]